MKREFLEGLKLEGLTKEITDGIMNEHGKSIESKKAEAEALKTESTLLKEQMKATQEKLKEFDGMDFEKVKESAEKMKAEYETNVKSLNEKFASQDYEFKTEKFLNGHEFANDLSKTAVKSEFLKMEFKETDGKFLGADDFIKNLKESQPTAFKIVEAEKPPEFGSRTGNNTDLPKDVEERRKMLEIMGMSSTK